MIEGLQSKEDNLPFNPQMTSVLQPPVVSVVVGGSAAVLQPLEQNTLKVCANEVANRAITTSNIAFMLQVELLRGLVVKQKRNNGL